MHRSHAGCNHSSNHQPQRHRTLVVDSAPSPNLTLAAAHLVSGRVCRLIHIKGQRPMLEMGLLGRSHHGRPHTHTQSGVLRALPPGVASEGRSVGVGSAGTNSVLIWPLGGDLWRTSRLSTPSLLRRLGKGFISRAPTFLSHSLAHRVRAAPLRCSAWGVGYLRDGVSAVGGSVHQLSQALAVSLIGGLTFAFTRT
jgi:hypothetical protein